MQEASAPPSLQRRLAAGLGADRCRGFELGGMSELAASLLAHMRRASQSTSIPRHMGSQVMGAGLFSSLAEDREACA